MCSHSECTNYRQMRKSLDNTTNHLQGPPCQYMVCLLAWHLVNMWGWHAPLSPTTVSKEASQCTAGVSGAGATAESATSWNGGASLSLPHRHRERAPDGGELYSNKHIVFYVHHRLWEIRVHYVTYLRYFLYICMYVIPNEVCVQWLALWYLLCR